MDNFDISQPDAVPQTAEQAKALVEHWSSPTEPTEIESQGQEAEAPPAEEFTIKYRGKDEKYPLDKILSFANQGRDYSEKMRQFRLEREAFEKESQTNKAKWQSLEERLTHYADIEEYIKKDPAWYDYLVQSYQHRIQGNGQANPTNDPLVQSLSQEVRGLKEVATRFQEKEAEITRVKEDEDLDRQIQDYRGKYGDFDWVTVDENGLDLEKRILDHAIKNNITSFRAAANDYLFDEHVNRAKAGAKEEVGKDIQKKTKLGLGPVTDRPTMPMKRVQNVATKSWDEITREALEASGLS